ncbi:TBC1 domain family member 15 [Cryptotermes secundus]|uniref:TBC1 domain family member 15 n=2 Tax=Cryptotermes secundus TaxID=105785 RepID=A0A2J7RC25_9NEOP|nr:TBC1 domain family member 15 isoform X1 [Cryptotermes secundus]PNF38393.1 TBC1 domain family member 15 [Cryptotermes secundus]
MDELNDQGVELYSHHGVLVKSQNQIRDDDSHCSGTLSIIEYSGIGKCIEWKPTEVLVDSETNDQEWAMVNAVGRRNRTSSGSNESQSRCRSVRIEVAHLKSFRVTRNRQQVTLMERDGTTHSVFFFQHGNADCFVAALKGNIKTVRSKKDKHLYIVPDEPESQLDRSFAELELFTENTTDVVWKFVRNLHHRPYETTLETFAKLTDIWLFKSSEQRREEEVAELLNRSLTLNETSADAIGEEYAVVDLRNGPLLPPRPPAPRGPPLSIEQWAQFQDEDGHIVEVEILKDIIFRGGVVPNLRYEVWKFLLGYFPWDSTHADRQKLRKQKVEEYFQMKLQWRSITPGQEQRFSDYRERKSLVEKDVNRTDRTLPFFAGENNENLMLLSDILMTYVMYNFDLGYVQGMSDLLSPILCVMTNEVDAFWCFVGFMDKVCSNFELDQAGMKQQLQQLHCLLSVTLPDLSAYLEKHESGNMFFCFRWLLVLFKREFSYQDIMRLWEVLWTDLPCPNFHLLLCVAVLDTQQHILMENNYGFTEILKHINDLSLHIELDSTLSKAEGIYHQLTSAICLPDVARKIIGLDPLGGPDTLEQKEPLQTTDIDNGLKVEEGPESLETLTFSPRTGEVAFERSLNLNYL